MKLLFVCMGNICRSPTAEGVMRQRLVQAGLAERITVDSAGTHNFHPGKAPDVRTQKHAALRGYDLSALRARQGVDEDFDRFDLNPNTVTPISPKRLFMSTRQPRSPFTKRPHRPSIRRSTPVTRYPISA